MTNDERNSKPECRITLITLSRAVAGFVLRISSFLRPSSFGFENCSLFNQKAGQRTGESGRGGSVHGKPPFVFRIHRVHEPRTSETAPPRCCRHLAGSAFLWSLCRQDAGSTLEFMESHGKPPGPG